jgi:chorismate-pyruvate lyase
MDISIFRRLVVLASLLPASIAGAEENGAHPWKDGFTARLEALALLQTLNADLLSNDSATLTLERWCASHDLANPPRIVAERVHGSDKTPTTEQRQLLAVDATEPINYRRVRLSCGSDVLSEADNWYVPSRLTPEMNRSLDTSDTPFGRVVLPLNFRRRTISAKLLWSPLPQGWEMGKSLPAADGTATLTIPHSILEHRAVLTLPNGTPFSYVTETYTNEVLAFPQPELKAEHQ